MIYLTVGESYSGVFKSQVIDVCRFMSTISEEKIHLVSFISIRGFMAGRRKIKKAYPKSSVFPMFPRLENWRMNFLLLWLFSLFFRPKRIMARGAIATNLALQVKKIKKGCKVIFDGRGAYVAEWSEYDVVGEKLKKEAFNIEKDAIIQADFRLAVSEALVNYWRKDYNYGGNDHVVIPCTLNADSVPEFDVNLRTKIRGQLGYRDDESIIVYAGSSAGWQSIKLIDTLLMNLLNRDEKYKVLLLSKFDLDALSSYQKYPDRITQKWVKPNEVHQLVSSGDYGILFRENTVTNQVASPTKFGEYLAGGLKVLISEKLGDYTDAVKNNNLGIILEEKGDLPLLAKVSLEEKSFLQKYAFEHMTKKSHKNSYLKILTC